MSSQLCQIEMVLYRFSLPYERQKSKTFGFFHSEACNQSLCGGREKKSGHLIEVEKGKRRNSFVKQLRHASIFKSFHDKYSTEEINN